MNSADLMNIGAHCSRAGCGQLDFLPFECDCCGQTFCLDHRTYASHACPKAAGKELRVFVCPICARSVKLQEGRDIHELFDEHTRTSCDPDNYKRVHRRPRCPVKGCRERLGLTNAYVCKRCKQRVCLAHRLESDHECTPVAPQLQPSSTLSSRIGTGVQRLAASTAAGLAAAGAQATRTSARPATTGRPDKQCPLCIAAFHDTEQLVQHVARTHPDSGGGPSARPSSTRAQIESCPECGQTFDDPVKLVQHVHAHRFSAAQSLRRDGSATSHCAVS